MIGRSKNLTIGALFDRPQPGSCTGKKVGFLPPAASDFVRAVLQQELVRPKSEKNFWADEMERRRIPHFRTEDLL